MAISYTVAIDSARENVTLTDAKTYTSPARSGLGIFVSVAKVDFDNNETDLDVTTDTSDEETDTTWTFSYSNGDGYYKVRRVDIPDFNSASTYAQYDAVFQPSTNRVYRSRQNNNTEDTLTNTTYWQLITDPASLADNKDTSTESENIDSLVYERVFTENAKYAYGNLISENSMYTTADDEDIIHDYDIFSLLLNGAITADERTEVLTGELICRKIESKFIDV